VRRLLAVWGSFAVAIVLAACAPASAPRSSSKPTTSGAISWVDESVTFTAGSLTIYATFRHPVDDEQIVPGALLIAGSGPTDRNGNSPLESGPVDTLSTLADWLSADGVATLRYDKLGSGETGLGPYAAAPDTIGIEPYEQESLAGLEFLAARKGIDDRRLAVFGHSEGALFALLLATGHAGHAPPIRALGLIEPLSLRYLDLITVQVEAQVSAQLASGQITRPLAAQVDATLAGAVSQLRRSGEVPANLPYGLSSLLNASTARFLYQADKYDPAALAAGLAPNTPVLVSCSNADLQVSCTQVAHLVAGLTKARAATDFVHLSEVDHVLKVDPTGAAANYTKPLEFSPQLESALSSFVQQNLQATGA
jgi:alpha-beta hydrolase superfamily lysophospholipase